MRAAHASIALGTESRAASAVASATLTHNDLRTIPGALALARLTKDTLTRLLAFTLIYNFTGITLAAAGLLHPVTAAILMLASSATVLAFAQRKLSIPEKTATTEKQSPEQRSAIPASQPKVSNLSEPARVSGRPA